MSPHEFSLYSEYFVVFLVGFQHRLFLVVVQSLSHVQLFATPWTAAHQASLSFIVSQITQTHVHWVDDDIQPSVAPFSSCPQSFPVSVSFPMSQLFATGDQSIGASASATTVLPMNIQGWFPLELADLSPHSPRDSQESSPIQKHQFFSAQPS